MQQTIKIFMLLALMMVGAGQAWGQESNTPDLGYILCDPANVSGGSLTFYKYNGENKGDQIVIDATTHKSERLNSSDVSHGVIIVAEPSNESYVLKEITIEKFVDSDMAMARRKTTAIDLGQTISVDWDGDFSRFFMPDEGANVSIKATFEEREKTKLGDEGHSHISYVTFGSDGKKKTVRTDDQGHPSVYVLDGSEKSIGKSGEETWYVAKGTSLNYTTEESSHDADHFIGLTLDGTVHLILADDAQMHVETRSSTGAAISGGSLIVYGQGGTTEGSTSEGKLIIKTDVGNDQLMEYVSALTINGGIVETNGKEMTARNITIRGGKVTATSKDPDDSTEKAISAGNITILGGQVTANGKVEIYHNGTITLGWSEAEDFVKASSYDPKNGAVKIADRQIMTDGTNTYYGTLYDATTTANGHFATLDALNTALGGKTLTQALSGDGTTTSPYEISNYGELKTFASIVNGGLTDAWAILKDDIVCKNGSDDTSYATDWTPIGNDTNPYTGTFDGDGKSIIGLSNTGHDAANYQGLFGEIGTGAEVKGVILTDARITGAVCTGGIAGRNNGGTIRGCFVEDNVTINVTIGSASVNVTSHGGIVGNNYNNGLVSGCVSKATVNGDTGTENSLFGGVAGYNNGGTIENCLYLGSTVSGDLSIGAIVGSNNSTARNCYFTDSDFEGKNGSGTTFTFDINNNNPAIGSNTGTITNCGLAYMLTLDEGITSSALTVGVNTVAPENQIVTLSGSTTGYVVTKDGTDPAVTVDVTESAGVYSFTMPASNVTVSAFGYASYADGTITQDENGYYSVSLTEGGEGTNPLPISGTVKDLDYSRPLTPPTSDTHDYMIDGTTPANLFTVCLPYEPTAPTTENGMKYYTLSSVTLNSVSGNTLNFTEVTTAPAAFTPYMVAVTGNSTVTESCNDVEFETSHAINSTPVQTDAGNFTFTGTLTGLNNTQAASAAGEGKVTYILQHKAQWGKVKSGNNNVKIPPFRAFIVGPDVTTTSGARELNSSFDGEAAGIDTLRLIDSDGTERWYDLNGRRIDKPTRKGVFIHGGRKEVIR